MRAIHLADIACMRECIATFDEPVRAFCASHDVFGQAFRKHVGS
jgi:protein tyrosine phosphatase (PTP) superfamily phosphohydrolase (DUF442 family)